MGKLTRAALRKRLAALRDGKVAPAIRGFELEFLMLELLRLEGLDASGGFRPAGEQIDGFFAFDFHFFHLECKWEDAESPASAVYSFRGKFEGKLIGTMGVFVSMSGFSSNVAEVLRYGKTIDVVLFNADDIGFAFAGKYAFSEILRTKLRRAAQYGEPYYPFQMHLDEVKSRGAKALVKS